MCDADMSSTAFIEPLPVIDFVEQLLNKDLSSRPFSDADRVKVWGSNINRLLVINLFIKLSLDGSYVNTFDFDFLQFLFPVVIIDDSLILLCDYLLVYGDQHSANFVKKRI